jgi:hypothetical protein
MYYRRFSEDRYDFADKDGVPSSDQDTIIRNAASQGIDTVVGLLLVDEGISPSSKGQYPLRIACRHEHSLVVERLLTHPSVDPTIHNSLPLFRAVQNMKIDIIRLLLQDGRVDATSSNYRCFVEAYQSGSVIMMKALLEGTPNCQLPYQMTQTINENLLKIYVNSIPMLSLLIEYNAIQPCLLQMFFKTASENNRSDIVRMMLQLIPPDDEIRSVELYIGEAARYGRWNIVKIFIETGHFRYSSSASWCIDQALRNDHTALSSLMYSYCQQHYQQYGYLAETCLPMYMCAEHYPRHLFHILRWLHLSNYISILATAIGNGWNEAFDILTSVEIFAEVYSHAYEKRTIQDNVRIYLTYAPSNITGYTQINPPESLSYVSTLSGAQWIRLRTFVNM